MTTEKFSLKDHLFNPVKIDQLASEIKKVYPEFKDKQFKNEVLSPFQNLELKQRINHIASCLHKYLPKDFNQAIEIIIAALPKQLDESKQDGDFGEFIYAPYGEYISEYGCTKDHLKKSLNALKEITKRFSVEFAIRPFINHFTEHTLAEINKWCDDQNYHVRRLCSEGTRSKLPWAMKVNITHIHTLPLLNKLFMDNTRYVTRSVANHLNDISKTHPQIVLQTLQNWQKSKKQNEVEMQYIIKHALRTLIKEGNAAALAMVGIGDSKNIKLTKLNYPKIVKMGATLEFSFEIESSKDNPAIVDYIISFQNKIGQLKNRKVFKLKTFEMIKNKKILLTKRHPLREMTTRQLYPGPHKVQIQVNGTVLHEFIFILE
ncbi:MAG: hypothetical protein RLZZ546_719 [Bacteroidota bacterium]|jgi:3-methyladenine DNA glycosylase AlkC